MASSGTHRRLPRAAHSPPAGADGSRPRRWPPRREAGRLSLRSVCVCAPAPRGAWWKGLTSATALRLARGWLASTRASISRCAGALSAAMNWLWAHRPTRATVRTAADAGEPGVPITRRTPRACFASRSAASSSPALCWSRWSPRTSTATTSAAPRASTMARSSDGWRASPPRCSRSVRGSWRSAACSSPASRPASVTSVSSLPSSRGPPCARSPDHTTSCRQSRSR